jgi:hypothetical protein
VTVVIDHPCLLVHGRRDRIALAFGAGAAILAPIRLTPTNPIWKFRVIIRTPERLIITKKQGSLVQIGGSDEGTGAV